MLLKEFRKELVLEVLQGFTLVTPTGYGDSLSLSPSGPYFNQVLDIVVVDIVCRRGSISQRPSNFHQARAKERDSLQGPHSGIDL